MTDFSVVCQLSVPSLSHFKNSKILLHIFPLHSNILHSNLVLLYHGNTNYNDVTKTSLHSNMELLIQILGVSHTKIHILLNDIRNLSPVAPGDQP